MKGKIFVIFAVFAMVILFGTPALAQEINPVVDNEIRPIEGADEIRPIERICIITSDAAEERYYDTELDMDTNKCYDVGEPVEITITNNQANTVGYTGLSGGNNLIITNIATGKQVVNTGAPIMTLEWLSLEPGESFTYTWDQCYIHPGYTENIKTLNMETLEIETTTIYHCATHTNEQVPGGVYRIHWNGCGWYAETKIVIGQPGDNPPGLDNVPDNQGTAHNPNL